MSTTTQAETEAARKITQELAGIRRDVAEIIEFYLYDDDAPAKMDDLNNRLFELIADIENGRFGKL